ncbi:hypothetical protein FB562_0459 [Homoserinimonas aerilata]|uniref:Uncharacterized protein n=2 Tax=Homoserinimonas aerilata TaxID=1162970 RepID=A0A542YHB5_9MICO|nr:hypothetical protein FB562_0459 [Homoserinimonas aerilata]
MLGTVLANSGARKTKQLELEHSARESDRAEKRRVYAEYIDCMDQWRLLAPDIGLIHCEFDPPAGVEADAGGKFFLMVADIPSSHPKRDELAALERMRDDLWERWRTCLGALKLIGDAEVADRAERLFWNYQSRMNDAWSGELSPQFDDDLPLASELVGMMRFDLGLDDGYEETVAV